MAAGKYGWQPAKFELLKVGISAREMGRRFDLSYRHVENVLRGKTAPVPTTLKAIADTVGMPIEDIFTPELISRTKQKYPEAFAAVLGDQK